MEYKTFTKSGYELGVMASMLQKSIRRGEADYAGFAANEMFEKYNNYLWKRLLIISAEDVFGIMTQEIVALKQAQDMLYSKSKTLEKIFVSKAITLLVHARKNRDADYVACNFMMENGKLNIEKYLIDIDECKVDEIPQFTYDCHTKVGRMNGKTKQDMIIDEQAALNPHQIGLFDNASWDNFLRAWVSKK